jgi:hypothetical protein
MVGGGYGGSMGLPEEVAAAVEARLDQAPTRLDGDLAGGAAGITPEKAATRAEIARRRDELVEASCELERLIDDW